MTSRPGTGDPWPPRAALVRTVGRGALVADGPVGGPDDAPTALLGEGCGSRYPVRSGVPVLLPPESAAEYAQRFPSVDWLVTDVEAALGAGVVADVLALPVADASQDMVLAEHVLEHVVDPVAACREIERVLRPGRVVLAKVPFNYPWHGAYVDFFRFTPAGFLAAFRTCDPVQVGHGPGPFSSVAYLLQHDWVPMFRGRRARRVAAGAGRLGLGWLKHLDRFVIHRPGSPVGPPPVVDHC